MSHLEALKQKLMVKPTLEERQRIAIVIKGDKTTKKQTNIPIPKEKTTEPTLKNVPIIVDETNKGYDRQTLLKKLAESKMSKVTTRPIIEVTESHKTIEPILQTPSKKAKK